MLALFCSRACPGSLILRACDLAVALRDARVPVIGGFQTPVEREMLDVLLRGDGLVTIVEARGERAGAVLVVHAHPGGATEALAREAAGMGKRLLTLASGDGANDNLLALGAVAVAAGDRGGLLAGIGGA